RHDARPSHDGEGPRPRRRRSAAGRGPMRKKKKKKRTHPSATAEAASYVCPACLETVDTFPDPGGGQAMSYVEDCSVCCRPNVLAVTWDEDAGRWRVEASRE